MSIRMTPFIGLRPMTSRGGNDLANQQIMFDVTGETFVSYGSKIAYKSKPNKMGKCVIVLDEYYWNYSRTTSKYRNEFLGFGVDECRRRIKSGEIKLMNLNKERS